MNIPPKHIEPRAVVHTNQLGVSHVNRQDLRKRSVTYDSERAYQCHLCDILAAIGYRNILAEVQIGRLHRIDILATDNDRSDYCPNLVVECKSSRPASISESISQIVRYRGAIVPYYDVNSFRYCLSWPGNEPSKRYEEDMKINRLFWLTADLSRTNIIELKEYR